MSTQLDEPDKAPPHLKQEVSKWIEAFDEMIVPEDWEQGADLLAGTAPARPRGRCARPKTSSPHAYQQHHPQTR